MKKYVLILPLVILITACGGSGNGAENENAAPQERGVPVTVNELQPSTFQHFVNVQGSVESDKTIMISPKVVGTVQQVSVRAGDRVQQGEVLARLDGEITRSQINEVQTKLELARDVYERRKKLSEKNIGAEVELLQAENNVESLESQLATLREQFDNYNVKTSISGRVSQVMLKVGETVSPQAPVFQIANSEALKVTAAVSEAYLPTVEETDSVVVSFPSVDREIRKRIDVVNEVINPGNRTFGVEVFIPSLDGQIRPNMLAKLRINNITQDSVIVVSINNIQQEENESFVYVAEQTDSTWVARRQPVQTGPAYNGNIVVTEGLQPGDRIITTGDTNVADDEPIRITNN